MSRLIVIGGVAGGTSAASKARRTDKDMEIVLYEKGEFVSYGACDEPYFIAGVVPSWEDLLVRKPEEFKQRQNIEIKVLHEVTKIDPKAKTVTVKNIKTGEVFQDRWDKLIIATGASPRKLGVPGDDLDGVFSMKFLHQAVRIRQYIDKAQPKQALIIGAGLVALEMAEALRSRGIEVTLAARGQQPAPRMEDEIATRIISVLSENGVHFIPECRVEKIEAGHKGQSKNIHTNQCLLKSELILSAIGVEPATKIAAEAGVELGERGAIVVDQRQATNIPDIYAAGDCCQTINKLNGKPIYSPLGDVANKQGWTAGENAAGGDALFKGTVASSHFKVFDLEVGVTGLTVEEATEKYGEVVHQTIEHGSRSHAQPARVPITVKLIADKASGRLVGAQIAGKEGAALRINTLAVCIQAGLTIDQIDDLDFAYAPPFSPVIDPILTAAKVLKKKIPR